MASPSTDGASGSDGDARSAALLAAEGLCKQFAGVPALREVSMHVDSGEVLAVIGENGAGKSTLMNILAGVLRPNAGRLLWRGDEVRFRKPADALLQGISLIHQELNLVDNLSVAENLFLGREPNRFGWVDRQQQVEAGRRYLRQVGLEVDPRLPLERLSIAEKQLVEIAKAVSTGARILIMDEPTSSLTHRETQRLFELVDGLRRRGTGIIYISHRLAEVQRMADRVEVLRDGRGVACFDRHRIDHDQLVRAMVGRDPQAFFATASGERGEVRLSVSDLQVAGTDTSVSLDVRGGEIVVLAGLIGSGRSELLETIFGLRRPLGGSVAVDGRRLAPGRVRRSIAAGLALVSEDRKATGLHLQMPVAANLTMAALADAPGTPRLDPRWESATADQQMAQLRIKAASRRTPVVNLSGGNQQKVALGKWLVRRPGVLLLDEPTRGVDVGARHEIYQLLQQLADDGLAILAASSDLEEVVGIASRVLVMHDSAIAGQLDGAEVTEPAIMAMAVGGQAT